MKLISETCSMARRRLLAAGLTLALGGGVYAATLPKGTKGTKVYIRAKNTRLMKSPDPTADALATLQPGAQVSYVRQSEKNKQWHEVMVGGLDGFVFQSNLSQKPPKLEDLGDSSRGAGDLQVYATKGAAIKALGAGAIAYGSGGTDKGAAVRKLLVLEALSSKISDDEVAEHARRAGIFAVVGKVARRARHE